MPIDEGAPSSSSTPWSFRKSTIPYLTKIAYASTPFITTFLLIHLSAPALASVGGSSLSSQTMILGREYYQTSFGEKYLVLGPIAVHALSGLTKRLLSPSERKPRPLRSLLSITGYSALFLFLPIHFLTHRLYPTTPDGPVYAVGPAELDFEFVKFALHKYPWVTWGMYTGLLASVALHLADGANLIWNAWISSRRRSRSRRTRIIQAIAVVVLPAFTGLVSLAKEPVLALSSTVKRFEGALTRSFVYRLS